MLARNEVRDKILDLYGTCARDTPPRNDCYWGKDDAGRENGCLKVGWLGRRCPYWQPANDALVDVLVYHYTTSAVTSNERKDAT